MTGIRIKSSSSDQTTTQDHLNRSIHDKDETAARTTDEESEHKKEEEEKEDKSITRPFYKQAFMKARTTPYRYDGRNGIKAVQAVVLSAGPGSRMTTLVTNTHKCLLPIATIPMIYYPIHMLQSSGFAECLVVVSTGCEEAVREMAREYGLSIKLDIHSIDPSQDPGTLDSMRHIAGAIREETVDVMIVSSDIVSDLKLSEMCQNHRYRGAAVTMLTAHTDTRTFAPTPGLKQKSNIGPDIVMESIPQRQVMMSISAGDYGEQIKVPHSLSQHGSILVSADQDAHLYIVTAKILKQYVLSPTSPCADMASIKAEVIPHLIKQQNQTFTTDEYEEAIQTTSEPFASLIRENNCSMLMGRHSQYYPQSAGGRACYSYHYGGGFCIRANTIQAYWHLNTMIPELLPTLCPDCPVKVGDHSASTVMPKAVVKGNTLLGSNCTLSDRTTVTNSSLGRNCVVSPGCRVTGSVLLDGVHLEQGCIIDNSIVCCTIDKEKCTISNCIVASSRTLHPNKTVTGDTLESTQFYNA